MYAILFILGYRVLKRFFAPNFGEVDQSAAQKDHRYVFPDDKSNEVEDVDYEEVE